YFMCLPGGGAILTNDSGLAGRAKHLTTTAKVPHAWAFEHDEIGYNYRLPNINAALGCAQLEALDAVVEKKRRLASWYAAHLGNQEGVEVLMEPRGTRSNYWLVVARLNESVADRRDWVLDRANEFGVRIRPVWKLIPSLKMYRDCPRADLSVALEQEGRVVCLPSSPFLAEALS
ncbi:MAG: DegT/DnrJ/EryC1/StrS family aminotransferase, partial [Bdellovibrionales bacterium]|nr:DegT/DnrJ/EryC1/StrS family aminotransferase [Bdellovibrionales bacterium]